MPRYGAVVKLWILEWLVTEFVIHLFWMVADVHQHDTSNFNDEDIDVPIRFLTKH